VIFERKGRVVSKIVVLATGGTIAGRAASAADHVGYQAGVLGPHAMLQAVLGDPVRGTADVYSFSGHQVHAEQVAQIDSKDMVWATWRRLLLAVHHALAAEDTVGVVVPHGTDTLEETAYVLQRLLQPRKPVVLVSAMRPASALSADGPQNLMDALCVAAHGSAQGLCGVLAVASGCVHGAADVVKAHPYRVDAFSSGDAGVHAYVEQQRLRVVRAAHPWPSVGAKQALSAVAWHDLADDGWPRVGVVHSGAEARAEDVDLWLAAGVRALAIVGTGNATVHQRLWPSLQRAYEQGLLMRRTTRCAGGSPAVPAESTGSPQGLDLWCPISHWPLSKLRLALAMHVALGLPLD
jgi:L-asparaginase